MKKSNIFRILAPVFGLGLAMLVAFLISGVFSVVTGVAIAMAGAPIVADTVSTENVETASSELNVNYVSDQVVQMRPSATPLDTIMRNIGKPVPIKSFTTEFYAVDARSLNDTVATAYVKGAGDGNATSGDTTFPLVVDNINAWTEDDTALFVDIDGSDGGDLVCLVIGKSTSANTITIQPLNGLAGADGSGTGGPDYTDELILPAIAENTVIVRMGNAKNELDAQTDPYAMVPTKSNNNMQLFMAQVEEGTYQRMHEQEVDFGYKDYEAQNIYDMRATMEFSFLYGFKKKMHDKKDTPKERYFTGGITREITKTVTYGTGGSNRTVNESDFVVWMKSIFTGNSGSDVRTAFLGDGLVSYISQIDTVSKQQKANSTEVKWGIKWNKLETNFGTLLYKHHPGLAEAGKGDEGYVLDMAHVEKHVMKPTGIEKLDLIKSGQRLADAGVISETSCLVLRYPDAHAKITPKA